MIAQLIFHRKKSVSSKEAFYCCQVSTPLSICAFLHLKPDHNSIGGGEVEWYLRLFCPYMPIRLWGDIVLYKNGQIDFLMFSIVNDKYLRRSNWSWMTLQILMRPVYPHNCCNTPNYIGCPEIFYVLWPGAPCHRVAGLPLSCWANWEATWHRSPCHRLSLHCLTFL